MLGSKIAILVFLCASAVGCGSTPARSSVAPSANEAADVPGGHVLEGPFAGWEEICGAAVEVPEGAEGERYERCSVNVTALSAGGPFEAMATYYEGTPFDGNAFLGLKTARGWFVQEIPDGESFGGGLSHHTPASASFDPTATRFEDGALRVVLRGSHSSFVPGRGPLGSSSTESTAVQRCGLRDGAAVCGDAEQVWSRSCSVADAPTTATDGMPTGEETCQETGTDVR